MSVAGIIALGYGNFGSTAEVITLGYLSGSAPPDRRPGGGGGAMGGRGSVDPFPVKWGSGLARYAQASENATNQQILAEDDEIAIEFVKKFLEDK